MHSTIWLLDFIRHTFARYWGIRCIIAIPATPIMRKNSMKNMLSNISDIITPSIISVIGSIMLSDITPCGCICRWHASMLSCIFCAVSGLTLSLSHFCVVLHAFSNRFISGGSISCLNCLYSLLNISALPFVALTSSCSPSLRLYFCISSFLSIFYVLFQPFVPVEVDSF